MPAVFINASLAVRAAYADTALTNGRKNGIGNRVCKKWLGGRLIAKILDSLCIIRSVCGPSG